MAFDRFTDAVSNTSRPVVLLGLGGSEDEALAIVASLCRRARVPVTVAHVVDTRFPWWGGVVPGAAHLTATAEVEAEGRRELVTVRDRLPRDLLVRTCLLHGPSRVAPQVATLVATSGHDIVVSGSRVLSTVRGARRLRRAGATTLLAPACGGSGWELRSLGRVDHDALQPTPGDAAPAPT